MKVSVDRPLVSVIIPTYNRCELLVEAIHSALDQSFQDFEILVVDDGSTDQTHEIIKTIRDDRLRYICEAHRGAPAYPRNRGIREARGVYVAFLDSDDLWLPQKLERQVAVFEKHSDIDLVYAQAIPWSKEAALHRPLPQKRNGRSGFIFEELFLRNIIPILTVMVRGSVLKQVGGFDESSELVAAEDYDLWLRITRVSRAFFLPEVVARYRLHGNNLSANIEKKLMQSLAIVGKFERNGWVGDRLVRARLKNIYKDASVEYLKGCFSSLRQYGGLVLNSRNMPADICDNSFDTKSPKGHQ